MLVVRAKSGPAERQRMARRKLSASEIVERLHAIDALMADGNPRASALRTVGVLAVEYDAWKAEYDGLLRTLGPLATTPPRPTRGKARRAGSQHPARRTN
jgi:hypothetical protein